MATGYIASTIPAKVIRVSNVTLFQVAMTETGDPLQWVAIAELNGITDPWIVGQQTILIPPVLPSGVQTGIMEAVLIGNAQPTSVSVVAPTNVSPSLNFSIPSNSQFLPLV